MYKKDKFKRLLRKYFEDKITDSEKENLFFLIHDEELENAAYCEQYNLWNEVPQKNKHLRSEIEFAKISEKLKITDDQITKDDLMLKGLEFVDVRSNKRRIYSILKYAAVLFIAAFITSMTYHFIIGVEKKTEISDNELHVPNGSKIKIILTDSTTVWLNSGSKLVYPDRFAESSREVFLEGEAFFDVHKIHHKPFYVRTPDINIKVLGTQFNVKAYSDENIIETTLVEGHIQIEKNLKPGEKAEKINLDFPQKAIYLKRSRDLVLGKGKFIENQAIHSVNIEKIDNIQHIRDADIVTAWKDDKLIFRNEQFSSLAKKLERWYDVEIKIMDNEVGNIRFTGSIKNESVEQAMNAFRVASSLDYKIDLNKIEVTIANK